MTDKEKLLPCPFCGLSKHLDICKTDYPNVGGVVYHVSCRTKGCHGHIWACGTGLFETEPEAIKAWNTRPDSLAELEKEKDSYKMLVFELDNGLSISEIADLKEQLADKDSLIREAVKAGEYLLSFVPDWAKDVPKGLDPTMYGTGSYEKDLVVQEAVKKATELLDKLKRGGDDE